MKKIIKKFKKYTFWVAFVGVFVLFLQSVAKLIGCDIDISAVESAIMSFCGVLVVLGVVTKDASVEADKPSTPSADIAKDNKNNTSDDNLEASLDDENQEN